MNKTSSIKINGGYPLHTFEQLEEKYKEYITEPQDLKKIKEAYDFIIEKHKGQFRKSGEPYYHHLLEVAYILASLRTGPATIISGLLHDVVEDTDYTLHDIEAMGFPTSVVEALKLLTHDESVPYFDYVLKIKTNDISREVKLADLRHNSDFKRLDFIDEKAMRRVEKYKKAIDLLSNDLD